MIFEVLHAVKATDSFLFFCGVGAGIAIGALLILGLDEEQRKRIAYTLSELKELPFRFFV